ncbi:DUF2202 domain-containing protein [Patescibacteria group bacterium]|nr:DUF2202 domain-containing protein [Patescibacteria group bacterium]
MKKFYVILGIIIIALVTILSLQSSEQPVVGSTYQSNSTSNSDVASALDRAINDEYKALVTYQVTIATFGEKKPFVNIVQAEVRHIVSLKALYKKYQLDIPDNTWIGQVSIPETFHEVCALGVQAEIENVRLYEEELIPIVQVYPDIVAVFENLKNASKQNHLPAFERCALQ